ncbi:hypothetical protein [Pseudomonas sp. AM8]|uniref:hypothetical protein n=1 Tax=Pseudomonas sp. AM8 TaxID=2983368 RepID=UPI002E8175C1|nr:hypothetical protein [Pseudomonas sp. AM8]
MIYAQVVDGKVVAVFSSVQDSEDWPGVVEVDEESGLYLDFLAGLKLNESLSALGSATQKANLQVSVLAGRLDTLDFAVSEGDASPSELEELPLRKEQLQLWRRYNLDLGRVPGLPGWPDSPSWPSKPESYFGV